MLSLLPRQVGRVEPVMVLRVDREKGYIDLSKRRVAPEDVQRCEDKFNKSKMVHSIMRHTAELLSLDLEELYAAVAWPLYKKARSDPDPDLESGTASMWMWLGSALRA